MDTPKYECGTCRGKGVVVAFHNLFVPAPSDEEILSSPTLQRISNAEIETHKETCHECKGLGVIYVRI